MKVNRVKFLESLSVVKAALSSSGVEGVQTNHFVFDGNIVYTFNNEIAVCHTMEGVGEFSYKGAIQGDQLYDFLNKSTAEHVDITSESDLILKVKCGRAVVHFPNVSEVRLPLVASDITGDWSPLPKGFIPKMLMATECCSIDMSKPVICCVSFVPEEGRMVSSDNDRLIRVMVDPWEGEPFLISGRLISHIAKLDPDQIIVQGSWVHFKNPAGSIISVHRWQQKEYPNYHEFFKPFDSSETLEDYTKIRFPAGVKAVLDRVGVFAKRKYFFEEEIHIKLEGTECVISAEAETKAKFFETIKVQASSPYVEVRMTPYLLAYALKESTTCYVGESVYFSGDGWKYLATINK